MITYWQQINGQFTKTKKESIDKKLPLWIDARNVTRDETNSLQENYQLEQDHILDMLDPDELSRMEEGEGYILTIVRVPVYDPQSETPYFTVPVGIIIKGNIIITLCWTDCEILKDFGNNRIKNIKLNDFPSFIVQIMNRANLNFLRYLKEINRRSSSIQNEMKLEIENQEIMQILALEKSLVYFTTSLKSNALLLTKMKTTRLIKFDDEDIDLVEGVAIDNRQAIEMADTYSNIMFGVMDAYNSIISNNLNIVMKKLAIINLAMMVPTFITSFFGMNFKLPFANLPNYWPSIMISLLCFISIFIAYWILNINRSNIKNARKNKKISRKHKKTLRRETQRLRRIERKIK